MMIDRLLSILEPPLTNVLSRTLSAGILNPELAVTCSAPSFTNMPGPIELGAKQAPWKRELEAKDQELAAPRAELDRVNATPTQETVGLRTSRSASPTGTNTTDDLINSLRDENNHPPEQSNVITPPSTKTSDEQDLSQETMAANTHDTAPPHKPPPRRTTGTYALSGTELRDITMSVKTEKYYF
ncbi:hypothetical protein PQX77_013831 [Marasmius sp. AFHP31]|nr:hypothetical protein PQX77_013831 [Marasmius sp. AFHP31]